MDVTIIIQMVIAAVLGAIFYVIIGIAPGTDETAVLAPVTLALILTGIAPIVVLTFFISSIIAKKLTDSIPIAVAGIPGGVMSAPMVEYGVQLKSAGLADVSIRKMSSGSVIGTLIAVPASLLLARVLVPLAPMIRDHAGVIFFIGAIFLALMAREKIVSLIAIIPFGILIMALRHFFWGIGAIPEDRIPFISFFLAITIGPMILNLVELSVSSRRKDMHQTEGKAIELSSYKPEKGFIPNPFKVLDLGEKLSAAVGALIGTVAFFMSPVGMTILIGEVVASRLKDTVARASRAISTMDAVTNAAYISGILIPLIALGVPLSPMAIGPGNPLFMAPPVFDLDNNLHHILSYGDFVTATLIGAIVGLLIAFPIMIKYSRQICVFVFKKVPHESFLAMFFVLVMILAYMDAGAVGIAAVLLLALVAGILNRWGVNYGVQFMILYAAPWMVSTFFS